jgi:hypothetical protein
VRFGILGAATDRRAAAFVCLRFVAAKIDKRDAVDIVVGILLLFLMLMMMLLLKLSFLIMMHNFGDR